MPELEKEQIFKFKGLKIETGDLVLIKYCNEDKTVSVEGVVIDVVLEKVRENKRTLRMLSPALIFLQKESGDFKEEEVVSIKLLETSDIVIARESNFQKNQVVEMQNGKNGRVILAIYGIVVVRLEAGAMEIIEQNYLTAK